jgi:hypothetical protein
MKNECLDLVKTIYNRAELLIAICIWVKFFDGKPWQFRKLDKDLLNESFNDLFSLLMRFSYQLGQFRGYHLEHPLVKISKTYLPIGFSAVGFSVEDYELIERDDGLGLIKWTVIEEEIGQNSVFYSVDDTDIVYNLNPNPWVDFLKDLGISAVTQWHEGKEDEYLVFKSFLTKVACL